MCSVIQCETKAAQECKRREECEMMRLHGKDGAPQKTCETRKRHAKFGIDYETVAE
jgi:hypothetical protein